MSLEIERNTSDPMSADVSCRRVLEMRLKTSDLTSALPKQTWNPTSAHVKSADVKSADFNVGLSNAAILLRGSIQSGSRLTLLALMRLVQFLHDVSPALSARRQIIVGLCGLLTNAYDIRLLASKYRSRT